MGLDLPKLVEVIIGETFCAVKNYLNEKAISTRAPDDTSKESATKREEEIPANQSNVIAVTQGTTVGDPDVASVSSARSGLKLEWRHHLFKCVDSAPLIMKKKLSGNDGFVVYVGSHSGHFIAVELLTGRLLWTTQFEEETPPTGKDGDEDDRKRRRRRRVEATASCSSDGNRIFVGCSNHRLYCLSASTGAILWSFLAGDALKCTPAVIPPSTSPGLGRDCLIFPAYDRKLYCLRDFATRPPEKVWESGLLESLCLAKPQIDSEAGVCYATTAKGDVLKVDLATGEKPRVRSGLGGPIFGAALLDTERSLLVVPIILGGEKGSVVVALDRHSLETIWKYQTTAAVFSGIVDCGDSYAFSCHDCFVHNISKGGSELWRAKHSSKVTATPQHVKIRTWDSEEARYGGDLI